jgi:rRNA maturation endonuclease Nob1
MQGKCKSCGKDWYGWALQNPEHRVCSVCGGEIEIVKDGGKE